MIITNSIDMYRTLDTFIYDRILMRQMSDILHKIRYVISAIKSVSMIFLVQCIMPFTMSHPVTSEGIRAMDKSQEFGNFL